MSRPFIVFALIVAAAAAATPTRTAAAQEPMRPWLGWRTIATEHYRFHYLPEFEQWTRDVAQRVEAVDSAIASLVGYTVPKPVHVVVHDPFGLSNGYALSFLDGPVSVWWAMPPDPRNAIGNFRTWGEMLAVHEITHLAHMTRPSRNPFRRRVLEPLLNVGPIVTKTPRWAIEGYATLIEGRITGTSRPNNVWRPAMLRQWAIEGRLPTYGQLSGTGDFNGGDFAYLGGSAFLEWLTGREGDSSLVHVWRRLTARRVRSFDAAFAGVYGDAPALLYGRHAAEVTRDAMAAKAALERAGLVEGELVQRLTWTTGDPAISPDGKRVAVVLSERGRPARLVVWRSGTEAPDTAAARRRAEALAKDPLDVPDRRFYPAPKRAEKTLQALNGRAYQTPRWFGDNRRVLVTRWMQRADGTMSPGLYAWDTQTGDVRRVTRGVGVLHGDPHPSGKDAVAMQCHWGHCDIVRVDVERGVMKTLLEGNARLTYYRPRYAPDGSRFVASITEDGRWDIVVADNEGKVMRRVGPQDGANRYDAQWVGNDSLVVVSERGGVANLEMLSVAGGVAGGGAGGGARALTRVTGAAVAPDVNRADGSIWFLSLHSRGFDVRRLARGATIADSVVAISKERFGFAGAAKPQPKELEEHPVAPPRAYGAGPRRQRLVPGGYASADGVGAFMTLFSGDIVGRLNVTATGAYGQPGTWQGGSLRAAWRFPWPAIELGAHGIVHEPSLGRDAQPAADSLDATLVQGVLAVAGDRRGEGWRLHARLGGGAGTLGARLGGSSFRALSFGEVELVLQRARGTRAVTARLRGHVSQGHTLATYQRATGSVQVTAAGPGLMPVQARVTIGGLAGAPHPFERFTIGGDSSPIADSSLFAQRYSMPMFPTAVATGNTMLAWRVALPIMVGTAFYEGASVADNLNALRAWHRAVGVERRFAYGPVPVAIVPRVDMRAGVAYTLDEPFRKKVRGFLAMRVEP